LQTDEESKRSELSPSAPLESSHAPEQAFERCSDGEAGDDIARHQDGPDGREICTTANQQIFPTDLLALKGCALATAGCYQANDGRSIRVAEARR